jgi:hypothetical protein
MLKLPLLKGLWIVIGYLILSKAIVMGLFQLFILEVVPIVDKSFFGVFLEALAILMLIWLLRYQIRRSYDPEFTFGFSFTFDFRLLLFLGISLTGYFIAYRSSFGLLMDQLPQSDFFTKILDLKTQDFENNPWPVILSMVILAPVFEETVVRGVILRGFLNNYNPVYAIIISGFFFGITHVYPPQIFNAFILGILFGFIYFFTRSLVLCILLHAYHNGLAIFLYSVQFEFTLISFVWSFLLFSITFWYFSRKNYSLGLKMYKFQRR